MSLKYNFPWLLEEFCKNKVRMNTLDTYFCRKESIIIKFSKDHFTTCKSIDGVNDTKIKHFLVNLIEERCPKLSQFCPNQVLCLAYLKNEIRVLSLNSILEIPSSRVYSLQFRTIHILPVVSASIQFFRVVYGNRIGKESFMYTNLVKLPPLVLSREQISSKIKKIAVLIREFVRKTAQNAPQRMVFDVMIDNTGETYLVKSIKISICEHKPKVIKSSSVNQRKRILTQMVSIKKPIGKTNKSQFVKMIARSIDKERIREKESSFGMLKDIKNLHSIEDLLEGLETTRPRVWSRDSQITNRSNMPSRNNASMSRLQIYIEDSKRRRSTKYGNL